jgi:hypothetical protein
MYNIKFDGKKALKMFDNLIAYSDGFIKESKAKEGYVANKMASASIEGFYEFLDNMARSSPGLLHHVYEWGQVGNPGARLVDLKKQLAGSTVEIDASFLQSESIPDGGNTPFYNKAEVMEEGITVVVNEVQAQALFFQVDGQEFFRTGPIVIENPGGAAVRGQFVANFETFYNQYFDRVYLNSIRFYDHFRNANPYVKNFAAGVRGGGSGVGRKTALSWIMSAPGGDAE